MKIAIVTDAWKPQVNGVVRTYENIGRELETLGHSVCFITPEGHATIALPGYRGIRVAIFPGARVTQVLESHSPDAIHIGTEGPLGCAARSYCLRGKLPFTTAYHTRFPEYLRLRAPVPTRWTYAWLRRFHQPARCTMVPTRTQQQHLAGKGFGDISVLGRGVDTSLFRPRDDSLFDLPRPVHLYLGRVAVEKNIEAFLDLQLPGSKVVVGDGPALASLEAQYPEVHFTGFRFGEELAACLADADVFVFPSRTDTFGIVMLEAMACGVPVAAYPVDGPRDVVRQGVTGWLDEDLAVAVQHARRLNATDCVRFAAGHSWQAVARSFLGLLAPLGAEATGLQSHAA